jgi:hypothetical protein
MVNYSAFRQLDHTVVPVKTGMMSHAISFFKEFGYDVNFEMRPWVKGDWGFAYFVTNLSFDTLQLTEPSDQGRITDLVQTKQLYDIFEGKLPWVHVAFRCDIENTVAAINAWTDVRKRPFGIYSQFEPVPGGKIFVSIPAIFWIDIELVPVR